MKVVIDDKIPFLKGVLESFMDVVYLDGSIIAKKDLTNADALIIRTRTKCDHHSAPEYPDKIHCFCYHRF